MGVGVLLGRARDACVSDIGGDCLLPVLSRRFATAIVIFSDGLQHHLSLGLGRWIAASHWFFDGLRQRIFEICDWLLAVVGTAQSGVGALGLATCCASIASFAGAAAAGGDCGHEYSGRSLGQADHRV